MLRKRKLSSMTVEEYQSFNRNSDLSHSQFLDYLKNKMKMAYTASEILWLINHHFDVENNIKKGVIHIADLQNRIDWNELFSMCDNCFSMIPSDTSKAMRLMADLKSKLINYSQIYKEKAK